jgi:EmrB/QacA subfamily drug resistance transporter
MTKQQRLVVLVSILASFVAFLDGSIVNVALPAIAKELGGGFATQQWITDAYLITLGSLILLAGSLSDVFGRKKILAFGLIGFLAASLICTVAPSSLMLIIARAVQGIAGALLVPSSLALIIATMSGKTQAKAIGTWTAWTGIAFIVGPLLGGFLVDALSWRWIFAINALPIVITLYLLQKLDYKDPTNERTPIDIWGAVLCTVGLGGPVCALIEQPQYGWGSPLIYGLLLAGVVALGLFVYHEQTTKSPMLPLDLFSVRNFAVGNVATLSIYAGLSIATFLIAIFLQQVGGYRAIDAGLAMLPITIIMFVLSPRFGALSGALGPRLFMGLGPIIAGLAFLYFQRTDATVDYWSQIFPAIVGFGVGLSMTVAPLTSAVLGSIDSKHAGVASAANNAISRIAGLVAIAALGLIIGDTITLQGFHTGMLATALLLIAGGVVSAIGIQNPVKAHQE